jgi:hypothetical protein
MASQNGSIQFASSDVFRSMNSIVKRNSSRGIRSRRRSRRPAGACRPLRIDRRRRGRFCRRRASGSARRRFVEKGLQTVRHLAPEVGDSRFSAPSDALFPTPSEKSCSTNSTIRSPAFSAMRSSCSPKRGGTGPAQFSESSLKGIETIAALAVRLSETVRRLSQACEARSEQVRSA